jgi:N-acetylgalactosamine-6-sulfatase
MDRRTFLASATGVATLKLLGQTAQSREQPNIIFILADDLGWADLGCYGHPFIQTPNVDRLASQGTRFAQFYTNSGVCSPSRAAFLTGNFPARHRIHSALDTPEVNKTNGSADFLDPEATNVARVLKSAGYATAHFGKWHLGSSAKDPKPTAYGFDEFRTSWPHAASDPYFWSMTTNLIVDDGIRLIEKNRNKPFYLNLWTLIPHAILNPTPTEMARYRDFGPPNVPYKGAHQIYYGAVSGLDDQIGRLLAKLTELGLDENTIVIFSSDNGPEDIDIYSVNHSGVGSTGAFRGRKRSLYEGGVRVPFIVRWPNKVPPGRVDNTSVVSAVDLLLTLAKLAGASVPSSYHTDGEDVTAALNGGAYKRKKLLMWEWRFDIYGHSVNRSPMLAIREGDWKLLMNPDRSRVELYDVPRDPTELQNLAAREPKLVARLSRPLLEWHKSLPPGPVRPSAGKNDFPGPWLAKP